MSARNAALAALTGLVLLGLWLAPAVCRAAEEARAISFPAISADGKTVYFSSWGDIWSAPTDGSALARRLTDNVAYEARPTLSPDGRQIVFLSDRFGNFDLFVMPEQGGEATRLTWDSQVDYPYDWNSDGSAVLSYTMRQDLWSMCAYEIPLDGSGARRLTGPDHDDNIFASYLGSDGELVYTRGPDDWTRQHYHGQENYDLYRVDLKTGKHTRLTDYDGKDAWPQPTPDGRQVYFVSSRDGHENIWRLTVDGGALRQITNFTSGTVRWPRISGDGDEIVYEREGELWRTDLKGGKSAQVRVYFADNFKHEMELKTDLANMAGEYRVSPNGNYFALVVYGDIFILKNSEAYEEEPDQDLSQAFRVVTGPGREMHVQWSPDSREITYVSDRDGQFDVFVYNLARGEERRITETPDEEWYPAFAPKGKRLAYYRGQHQLLVNEYEGDGEFLLYEGQLRNGPWSLGYEWAPDGYWLAVSAANLDYRSDVYIINIEDREAINVSFTPDWNQGGVWSPDGKYLAWTHQGDTDAEVMLLELNPEPKTYDTELLFPADKPGNEDEAAEDEEAAAGPKADEAAEAAAGEGGDGAETAATAEEAEAEAAGEEEAAADEEEEEEAEPLTIDMDRINLRARVVTTMQGEAFDQYFDPNSSYIVFVSAHQGEPSWWSVTIDGGEFNQLSPALENESPQFAPDGSKLYFLSGGAVTFLQMAGPAAAGGGLVSARCRVELDQYEIWDQMLYQGWRTLRDAFYDENMNGQDWPAILAEYRPRIRDIATEYEYGRLYREMLGELGASHLGYYSFGSDAEAPPEVTGSFGVDFDEHYGGPGWKVARVIADGPADQPGSELYPGDVVLSIDGREIAAGDNRARLLRNAAGTPMKLKVASGEAALAREREKLAEAAEDGAEPEEPEAERDVVIMPAPAMALAQLYYRQWVLDNRAAVYQLSGGRIGYQHIQSMDGSSLAQFRRELFTESREKDAIIIDVRFNGGGGITEQLVDILDRKPFSREGVRGAAPGIQPALYWGKPVVVLINAHSYSDAEYFPHIIKELGLGTVIGEPTGGNVIGTYDFPLLDGSMLRVPAWGIWLLDGTNMEGNGAQPDVFVDIDPEAIARGEDNQLEAAVKYLLEVK